MLRQSPSHIGIDSFKPFRAIIKAILSLLPCTTLLSCHQKELIGTYYYKSDLVDHKLDLRPDSTFSYEVIGDIGKPVKTAGKWSFNSKGINLKSYDSFRKITIIGSDSASLKNPVILIEGLVREDFVNEYVTFNDDTAKYYFEHNSIAVPTSLVGFKKLCLHAFETYECKIRNGSNEKFFKIIYNNKGIDLTWYMDDNWKFRDGKLYKDDSFFLQKRN